MKNNNKQGKYVPHHYTPILKKWHAGAGPRPSNRVLKLVDACGLVKAGTKDAFAVAMTLRPLGATQAQITTVLGQPHRNKIKALLKTGDVVLVPVAPSIICKLELKKRSR